MTFATLCVILLILGTALIARGLRGYAIDDHPLCRKCGFDLTGLPKDAFKCSECGADLLIHNAVRIGHRRRRSASLYSGIILLLLGLTIATAAGWAASQNIDWEHLKPTWYVIRETKDPTIALTAWNELLNRLRSGDLGAERMRELDAVLLAIQADPKQTWSPVYGDFIEASALTPDKLQAYARHSVTLSLTTRAKVRKGDPLPITIAVNGRVGSGQQFHARLYGGPATGELIRDPRHNHGGSIGTSVNNGGGGSSGALLPLDEKAVAAAAPGVRTINVNEDIEIRQTSDDRTPPLAKWTEHLTGKWELVPADAQTVEIINDPSKQHAVEQSVTTCQLRYFDNGDYLNININFNNLPVPVAWDIYVRADGREQKLSSIYVNGGNSGWGTGGTVKTKANKVDLIFRPSLKAAVESATMTKMWNGGITIKDVPIQRPTTSPTTKKS